MFQLNYIIFGVLLKLYLSGIQSNIVANILAKQLADSMLILDCPGYCMNWLL